MTEVPSPSDAANRTTGASLLRGGAWLSVALVLPQMFTLVISVAAARFLGPQDMGRQSYISFITIAAATLAGLGLPLALQRAVARAAGAGRPRRVASLAVLGWSASSGCALLAFGTVYAIGLTTYPDLHLAWALAGAVAAMTVVQSVSANILFGLQQFRSATIIGLSLGIAGAGGALAALAAGYGITGMFAAEAVTITLTMFGTSGLALRAVRADLADREPWAPLWRDLAKFSAVIGAGLVVEVVVAKRSEFIFLQRYSGSEQVAFYSVAFAAVAAAGRLPSAIVQLVLPAVSTLAGGSQHSRIVTGFGRGMRLMITFTVPLAAAAVSLGPLALRSAYGSDYSQAGNVLALLAPVPLVLAPLAAVSSATLNALGVLRAPLLCGVFALIVTLVLDVVLIPGLDAVGAALANNGGQIAASLPLIYLAQRRLKTRWIRPTLLRSLLVSCAAAAVTGWCGAVLEPVIGGLLALVCASVIGPFCFFGLATVLPVLDNDDAQWLTEALDGRAERVGRLIAKLTRK